MTWPETVEAILRAEYLAARNAVGCRAGFDAPSDAQFCRYNCSSHDLLGRSAYPAWFTDAARTKKADFKDPGATPITFAELAAEPQLERLFDGLQVAVLRREQRVIVERCLDPDLIVVKDGCHRLITCARSGDVIPLIVYEVRGTDWENAQFDMPVILEHIRGKGR